MWYWINASPFQGTGDTHLAYYIDHAVTVSICGEGGGRGAAGVKSGSAVKALRFHVQALIS